MAYENEAPGVFRETVGGEKASGCASNHTASSGQFASRFATAAAGWLAAMGEPAPAEVFAVHPAHEPLVEAIQQATRKQFRGAPQFAGRWADEAARYVLRDLVVDDDGTLTEGGVTSDQIAEDLAATPATAHGVNAAVSRLVRDLLADHPPAESDPISAAWHAVRSIPAPSLADWRYEDEVRARFAELKARGRRVRHA